MRSFWIEFDLRGAVGGIGSDVHGFDPKLIVMVRGVALGMPASATMHCRAPRHGFAARPGNVSP